MPFRNPRKPLSDHRQDLVKEWDWEKNGNLSPEMVGTGSRISIWWKCEKGPDHSWQAMVYSRVAGKGCPYCANQFVSVTNSLASTYPEIASEWHPTRNGQRTPKDVAHGSNRRAYWKCSKGKDHEWSAVIVSRTRLDAGCPMCRGLVASASNNLLSDNPELAKEWHPTLNKGLLPEDVTTASQKQVWWKCEAGHDHIWKAGVGSRNANKRGCPFCAGQRISNTNRLSLVWPDVSKEWHPSLNGKTTPEDVSAPGGRRKYWWQCAKNEEHAWEAPIRERIENHGCPYCSGNRLSHENSLAEYAPEVAAEWDYSKNRGGPQKVSRGSNHKYHWICSEDSSHLWTATAKARVNGSGCPHCTVPLRSSKGERRWLKHLRENFPQEEVIHHARPPWIGAMHLDIYFPDFGIAIEYQGRQHYQPVGFFGGEEAFQKSVERDKRKVMICRINGVQVIHVNKETPYKEVTDILFGLVRL